MTDTEWGAMIVMLAIVSAIPLLVATFSPEGSKAKKWGLTTLYVLSVVWGLFLLTMVMLR